MKRIGLPLKFCTIENRAVKIDKAVIQDRGVIQERAGVQDLVVVPDRAELCITDNANLTVKQSKETRIESILSRVGKRLI